MFRNDSVLKRYPSLIWIYKVTTLRLFPIFYNLRSNLLSYSETIKSVVLKDDCYSEGMILNGPVNIEHSTPVNIEHSELFTFWIIDLSLKLFRPEK